MIKSVLKTILPLFFFFSSFAQQWGDYTLYSVLGSTSTQLIDTSGNTFKTWTHTSTTKSGYSCYLMPGGDLWRSVSKSGNSFSGGPISGEVQKVAWDGTVLWDFIYSTTDYCTHHDICPLPNGNILLIAYERKNASQVSAAGCTYSGEVWSEKVVEVKPTGATTGDVVWEWKIWDHIVQNKDSTKANYQKSLVGHPELLNVNYKITKDWIHMNGIDYNPKLDQIAVSSHNTNEWYIIDHSTTTTEAATHSGGNSGKGGDFLYRWGNPAAYGATGTTVLNVTHDSHWIPDGVPNAGRLVGFNNKGVSSSKSSVDQIVTPVNGYNYHLTPGSAYEPTSYQRHACNGYTSNAGSSDQLANGNMLVVIALSGTMYELDPQGNSIWTKTVTGSIQQAHRYSKCFTDNQPPAIPGISINTGTLSSTSAAEYQWYFNGQPVNGATSQTMSPVGSGIYVVRVTDNNACVYRYSPGFKYSGTGTFTVTADATIQTICAGDSILITANTGWETGTTDFAWSSIPAGFSGSSKIIEVAPDVTTVYKVIASNNSILDTSEVTITVNAKPGKPSISQNGKDLVSSSGPSYIWYNDFYLIHGATGQSYTPGISSSYRVKIKNSNGCLSDFSDPFSFTAGMPIWLKENNFLSVYPNPGSGIFNINNPGKIKITHAVVNNVFGKTVYNTLNTEIIDLSGFSSGLYSIKFFNEHHLLSVFKLNLIK